MARPKDDGLKYFPFDVDFFEDPKIRALRGKYGGDGVLVYLYLLTKIYKKGYYLSLDSDDDFILFTAQDNFISENLTRQIIAYLFNRSLLDGKLAESVKALSAKSIQRRYQEAKRGLKRDVVVKAKYWLLEKAETLGFIKVCPENGFSEINEDNSENYSDKSEKNCTKESKGKENKSKESKVGLPPKAALTPENRKTLIEEYGRSVVEAYEQKYERWRVSKNAINVDAFTTISKWLHEDKPKCKDEGHGSLHVEEVEKAVIDKYKKLGGKKGNDET